MAAAAPAIPWVWHDVVPERLEPFQGQVLRPRGVERWHGWDYVLLDWTDATNRVACRYCGIVEYVWNPGGGWWAIVLPTVPAAGCTLLAREAITRRGRGSLVHLDECLPSNLNLMWRMTIHGCYLPAASGEFH